MIRFFLGAATAAILLTFGYAWGQPTRIGPCGPLPAGYATPALPSEVPATGTLRFGRD